MPRSQAKVVDGHSRHFIDTGGGSPAVVFLHGIPTNHLLWRETIRHIASPVRAIAPDLTGFGCSELPSNADLTPQGQAVDLLAFLDGLNVEDFNLVAHDYGFLVACEVLATAGGRVRGLVVTNSSLRRGDWSGSGLNPFRLVALPVVGEVAFLLARRWMLQLAFMPFVSEPERLTPELLDAFWRPFERGFDRTLLRLFRSRSVEDADILRWRSALASFAGPVTIVWGARDPAFRVSRSRDILELVPRARRLVIQNSNHFVPIDRPRVLARQIDLHIERQ